MKKAPQSKALNITKQVEETQLSLFKYLLPENGRYSNTVELYDFIPKYHWGKTQRINGKFLEQLERTFECRGVRYTVEIKPASIKTKQGERYYYPGQREELVEDALRKFVCEGQGVFEDGRAGVQFTLHQLQQELKSRGHSYSKDQIKESLLIMSQTGLIVKSEDGKALMTSNLIENLALSSRVDSGERTLCEVRFNLLVTKSIESLSFRQIDYVRSMSLKSVIARQLYKRMSHNYTQASITNPYGIMLRTIIRDIGLTVYEKLPNNMRDVLAAIEELKSAEVILSCDVQKVTDPNNRGKLLDAKFIIYPHPNFSNEQKNANRRAGDIDQLADIGNSFRPVYNQRSLPAKR